MRLVPTLIASALAALAPLAAHATNGYFSHGYGTKALGLAGAGIALPQDALAAATNPAGTAAVGERIDGGLSWFAPRRGATLVGNGAGPDATFSGDGRKSFFIPEFGYARPLSATLAAGVSVYGNGGMNTQYDSNPLRRFDPSGGQYTAGPAGVNLAQLFVSPSLAFKLGADHTLGVALNLAYQRFSAQGVALFGGFSAAPANVSNLGTDSSTGVGLRLGWIGRLTPQLSLGATWASKIHGRFDKYKGLFADGGGFDIPENYGVGLAFTPAPGWTLAADVQTIRYSQVGSVGNPLAGLLTGDQLGGAGGPGFGWRDLTVGKLGLQVDVSPTLTLRGGLSHARQPVPPSQTFFNILAPGVVQDHLTAGFTWRVAGGEWSGYAAQALGHTVNGSQSIPPAFGGGNANVRLKETLLGVSYGWRF